MGEAEVKGEKRAFDEIASVLCACHFTDGFCNGRDRPDCKCNKLAAAAIAAIKSRGVRLTWSPSPPLSTHNESPPGAAQRKETE